jgi:hypothetical protein
MNKHCYDLAIRVLISKEGRKFFAHALELDLVAEGGAEAESCKAMIESIYAQLSFAAQMQQPDLINHPAPKEFFKRWDEVNRLALTGIACPEKAATFQTKAIFVGITSQGLASIRSKKSAGFQRVPERALASA